jgi:GNAT superfamily N-acetyltransferase
MITFRALRQEELEEWFDHCMLVFNQGVVDQTSRQMFVNSWYNDPYHSLEGVRVAVEDGRILSGICIHRYQIYLAGEMVSMGGIASVSTKPEGRGRGLSTHLLQESIQLMESWGMKISLLATDLYSFYGRLGWQQVSFYKKTLRVAPVVAQQPLRVRPLDFERDLPVVMNIYHKTSSFLNGPVVRSAEYWNGWMKHAGHWWVAELPAGKVAACLRLVTEEGQVRVTEFTAEEGFAGCFDWMVGEVLRQQDLVSETVTCPVVIPSTLEPLAVTEDNYLMVRLVKPFRVGDFRVASTEQLQSLLKGSDLPVDLDQTRLNIDRFSGTPPFTFWEVDGF